MSVEALPGRNADILSGGWVRNLEALKWAGLLAMLVDHVGLFVVGASPLTEAVGALALPLFGIAFGAGAARIPLYRWRDLLVRLLICATAAQVCRVVAFGPYAANIVFGFALGLGIAWAWVRPGAPLWLRLGGAAAGLLLSFAVEFGPFGVAFLSAVLVASRTGSRVAWWLAGAAGAALWVPNGTAAVLLTVPVVLLVGALPRDLPRVRGAFYWAYVAQWPALWLVSRAW